MPLFGSSYSFHHQMASKTMVVYMLTELETRGSNYFAYAISEDGDIHEMFIVSIGKSVAKTLAMKLKKEKKNFLAYFSLNKQEECSNLRLAADKSKVRFYQIHNWFKKY